MRIGESHGEEEGIVRRLRMLAELFDGVGGAIAIQEIVIAAIHGFERGDDRGAGTLAPGWDLAALSFRIGDEPGLCLPGGLAGPGLRAVPGRDGPGGIIINADVVDLPQAPGVIAVVLKVLRPGGDVGHRRAQRPANLEDAGGGRVTAAEHGDARGRAKSLLHVAALKDQPACGEAVEVRGLHDRVAVAAKLRPHVIGSDEQDVGPRCRMGGTDKEEQGEERTHGW